MPKSAALAKSADVIRLVAEEEDLGYAKELGIGIASVYRIKGVQVLWIALNKEEWAWQCSEHHVDGHRCVIDSITGTAGTSVI